MPTLPLPPLWNGVPLDGGDLPVQCLKDVADEWAKEIQSVPVAPIRDAIQCGQEAMLEEYQRRSRYAAAQSDPLRATDEYLDEILEEHSCPRQNGQDNDSARAILFANQPAVCPNQIISVANSIISPYSSVSCRYAEQSDGWFAGDDTCVWSAHVFSAYDSGDYYATPNYPDRPSNINRRPPGLMPNGSSYGRWFLLRVPDISAINNELASVFDGNQNEPKSGTESSASVGAFFVGSGSTVTDDNTTFVFDFVSTTVDSIYNSIISAVNNAAGFGIRWNMVVDPYLQA